MGATSSKRRALIVFSRNSAPGVPIGSRSAEFKPVESQEVEVL